MLLPGVIAAGRRRFVSISRVGTPVASRADLEAMASNPDGIYYLTNDIDLAGSDWAPFAFHGVFDGDGHKIDNMTVTATSSGGGNAGLFSDINYAQIMRLRIANASCSNGTSANYNAILAGIGSYYTLQDIIIEAGGIVYTSGDRASSIVGYSANCSLFRVIDMGTTMSGGGTRTKGGIGFDGGNILDAYCYYNSSYWSGGTGPIPAASTATLQSAATYPSTTYNPNIWAVTDGSFPTFQALAWTLISSRSGLANVASEPQGLYRLVADLDLSAGDWTDWDAITFGGVLDGNGHSIAGCMRGTMTDTDRGCLFWNQPDTYRHCVQFLDLAVDAAYTSTTSAHYQGGMMGATTGCFIHNCRLTGTVRGGGDRAGGFSAYGNNSAISKCLALAAITGGGTRIGAVVGFADGTAAGSVYNVQQVSVTGNSSTDPYASTLAANDTQAADEATYTARHWSTDLWVLNDGVPYFAAI